MTSSPRSTDPFEHGTLDGYTNHKCRCQQCRTRWREWMSEYRAENAERINARRRARRRAARLRSSGQAPDLEALVDDELHGSRGDG